ncbi:dihydrolipoamide acetyltransferase family protein [[Mycobacterium] wendilense]|uniref:Dihydrolipoamide acetyltransferase component of pyruvate dehydrogenase complex n=1 Tax=[Mycobacterium] wendilense TaxID=3064284 RepID=A0ABN9NUI6_9MYCO|nr:dihydrolipoamide acetyltransferase family protein [Mycolicibacterium sp. MU0050]CAJ1579862.1 dihydrolipoamide acetyltransferase family protein [Mycolicibacterium sp. MU0050]
MATVVRMPEVLADTSEATIQSWLVAVGDEIAIGDPIAEIETDKAVVEYAAEVAGILSQLLVEPGTSTAVGNPIAVVTSPGEDDADIDPGLGAAATPLEPASSTATAKGEEEATGEEAKPEPVEAPGRRMFATPLVRKIAREKGIDLTEVTGTGPGGRIVRRDVDRLPERRPAVVPPPALRPDEPAVSAPEGVVDVPLSGMRKAIARRLTESKTTVPHFYVTAECRIDALLELRATVNGSSTVKISVNDFVLKAVAGALLEVPEANAIWNGDSIRRFQSADVAVAVAVDGGLVTPVLRGVERLPVSMISAQVADFAERARGGRIQQGELEGGSFSVSNLGMYGVTEFSAILNPPHSGILAVGAATQRPVVVDGELTVGSMMTVTLSADHRVIDGAVAAQWMAAFVRRIENPMTILI